MTVPPHPLSLRSSRGFTLLEILITSAVLLVIAGLLATAGGGAMQTVGLAESQSVSWESAHGLRRQMELDLQAAPIVRRANEGQSGIEVTEEPNQWRLSIPAPQESSAPKHRRTVQYVWSKHTGRITRIAPVSRPGAEPRSCTLVNGVSASRCVNTSLPMSKADASGHGAGSRSAIRILIETSVHAGASGAVEATAPRRSLEILVPVADTHVD